MHRPCPQMCMPYHTHTQFTCALSGFGHACAGLRVQPDRADCPLTRVSVSTTLVLGMCPGLAFFEAGMLRSKNTLSVCVGLLFAHTSAGARARAPAMASHARTHKRVHQKHD